MKEQFTTRIEKDILEAARAIASRERRSLNNTIEFLLSKAVESYEVEHGVSLMNLKSPL